MLSSAWQTRLRAIKFKNETVSMLAAEAGYEQAIYWMSQQQDMLSALKSQTPGTTGSLTFVDGACNYAIELQSCAGSRPVYKVLSTGSSGRFSRTVEVLVLQAISGWDMGLCAVPSSSSITQPVYFADSEIIDVPIQINDQHDSPDQRDIYITGSPEFRQTVGMGVSQLASKRVGGPGVGIGKTLDFRERIDIGGRDRPHERVRRGFFRLIGRPCAHCTEGVLF